jgi:tetratricopeptide (TPR) repeat protein
MCIKNIFKRLNDSELIDKGISLGKSGRCDEAIKCFVRALAVNPKNASAHYNLGLAYQSQGRIDDTIKEYSEALKINPFLDEARNNLGIVFLNQARVDEAIQQYKKILKNNSNDGFIHYNLGLAYDFNGYIEEAEKEYWEAINNNGQRLSDSSLAYAYSRLEYISDNRTHRPHPVLNGEDNTPVMLGGAKVLLFAEVDPGIQDGKIIGFAHVAIGQYEGQSSYYVFWCDRKWNVQSDDLWWSLEATLKITERSLGVKPTWRRPKQ